MIGAHKSDTVMVVRTRPVIRLIPGVGMLRLSRAEMDRLAQVEMDRLSQVRMKRGCPR